MPDTPDIHDTDKKPTPRNVISIPPEIPRSGFKSEADGLDTPISAAPIPPRTPSPRMLPIDPTVQGLKTPENRAPSRQPKDTPLSYNNDARRHDPTFTDTQAMHRRHAEEANQWIVGPMPEEDFLATFLPETDFPDKDKLRRMPNPINAFRNVPDKPDSEKDICTHFVSFNAVSSTRMIF